MAMLGYIIGTGVGFLYPDLYLIELNFIYYIYIGHREGEYPKRFGVFFYWPLGFKAGKRLIRFLKRFSTERLELGVPRKVPLFGRIIGGTLALWN